MCSLSIASCSGVFKVQEEAINNEYFEVIDKGRQIVLNFCL